ncbi:MAG: hypothetical protein QM708_10670 [Propioniciclava sp.]|uniref:hypothetical protein n=1 Tax=Propioniciclava sp. TaxID=2038686 RepID=UPI0039E31F0F
MRILAASAVMMLAACSVLPRPVRTNGPCPRDWQAAVVWSTQNGMVSTLSYVAADGSIEERDLPYIGFSSAGLGTVARRGDETVMVSNGNMKRDKTHLVTVSATCAVTGVRVDEIAVMGMDASPEVVFTTGWLNGVGWVRGHDRGGVVTAAAHFPDWMVNKPVVHDGRVYAFANDMNAADAPWLLVLNATTLEEIARMPLPEDAGFIMDALARDGTLYYPLPGPSDGSREGQRLGMIDLATLRSVEVALDASSPYLLAASRDAIIVGHTFMNPSFRPMNQYVWVTRYVPSTGEKQTFDIGTPTGLGVMTIAATDTTLFVLGTADDNAEQVSLLVYDAGTMELRSRTDIPRPRGVGHRYPAGLVTP